MISAMLTELTRQTFAKVSSSSLNFFGSFSGSDRLQSKICVSNKISWGFPVKHIVDFAAVGETNDF